MMDRFEFEDGDTILITFESTNSEWKQGVGLSLFGDFGVDESLYKDRIVLWETTSPKSQNISLHCEKTKRYKKKGLPQPGILNVKNVWDSGNGAIEAWIVGAAMLVDELDIG